VDSRKTGYVWIYGLAVIFGLTIIALIILPIINSKVAPALLTAFNQTDNTTGPYGGSNQIDAPTMNTIVDSFAFLRNVMKWVLYLVMFGVIVYMFVAIWPRERYEM
jgi:hypothetical protein